MKLRGIRSSKSKFTAFKSAREAGLPPMAPETALDPSVHKPTPRADGSIKCSCGLHSSPAAYARHMDGLPMIDAFSSVYVTGQLDPWIPTQAPAYQLSAEEQSLAAMRAESIDLFFKQQKRGRAANVGEGNTSVFFRPAEER